ncbi:unnamed protein product [Penicillium viridicatum]
MPHLSVVLQRLVNEAIILFGTLYRRSNKASIASRLEKVAGEKYQRWSTPNPIQQLALSSVIQVKVQKGQVKVPSLHSRWAPYRKPIKAQFGNSTEMEAQIDGYFRVENGLIKIILKTKAGLRKRHKPQVSMQEAAEVVSLLITQEVDPKRPPFLISQDGADIYITVAVFEKAYLKWITNDRKKVPSYKFSK